MSREVDVEQEVAGLALLLRAALAQRWREAYGASPASDVSAPLMRKALAWEIQARAFGGHSARTLRTLKSISGSKTAPGAPSAGSRLIREWNGATHEVEVLEKGNRWRGESWSSLSAIAREITGTTGPEPLPHPDHVIIDMNTGGVIVRGPMTKEDKAKWDMFRERKAECDRTIAELEQQLRGDPDYESKDQVLDEIDHERKIRAIIERVMPD